MATITLKKRTLELSDFDRKKNSRPVFLNVYFVIFCLIVFNVLLGFFYLSEFNAISTQGVIISDLESKRNELIIENEVWNMRIANLKSMDVIQQQSVVKRMVSIDPAEIEYVDLDTRP